MDSDHSYIMSLCTPAYGEEHSVYTYPNNLPPGDIFVDRIGWMPSEEISRYLVMGYRIWDENGSRLHFHGTPLHYDSLNVFRYPERIICLQDMRETPDLQVQMGAGRFGGSIDTEAAEEIDGPRSVTRVMPWDIRMSELKISAEGLSNLARAKRAFVSERLSVAAPCYTRESCLSWEPYGGTKLVPCPLKTTQSLDGAGHAVGKYPKIGLDTLYLSIKYPFTHVSLESLDRSDSHGIEMSHSTNALCGVCETLNLKELFEWGLMDTEIDLGLMQDLFTRRHCSFCRTLAQPIQVLIVGNPILSQSSKPFLVLKQDYRREYFGPIVSLRTVRGDIRGQYTLAVRQDIDFQLVRRMVETCTSEHGPTCGRKSGTFRDSGDLIVVDVNEMRLVMANGGEIDYITLNYVWGTISTVRTTKRTLGDFQKPGSLAQVGVSRVIQDAAVMVRALSMSYLWVDALCIIQDDEEHKLSQIRRMADIYGQSWLTIVSLTGKDCGSHLPGVSQPRPQLVEVVRGMPITAVLSRLSCNAYDQVYEQRAWTFQERLISRRCLYIGERQVYFECGYGETNDHEQISPPMDRYRLAHSRRFNSLSIMVQHMDNLKISGFHETVFLP
ncbi:MAG: hypothetical protein M1813_007727 [Trichoglossum hirsutum]|nr:MAG: hypothetical protein M1813_007727 [Trichoglossum hirsutum]